MIVAAWFGWTPHILCLSTQVGRINFALWLQGVDDSPEGGAPGTIRRAQAGFPDRLFVKLSRGVDVRRGFALRCPLEIYQP